MELTRFFSVTVLIFVACTPLALASIQIGATRVIYHAAEKDVSVQIANPGKYPVLLQSWTDDGQADTSPDMMRTPFILTPPLTRVNAEAGQTLRLSYTGTPLPEDRESVYWLNVLEIPPKDAKNNNQIQVAFRSRIKLFFRPRMLDDKGASAAINQLRWHAQGNKMFLSNPTPYYVSIVAVTLIRGGRKTNVAADMLPPHGNATFTIPEKGIDVGEQHVTVDAINDYGAYVTASVSPM